MLQHAFKEWAVICEALGQGQQSLILRKGGIDETDGEFALDRTQFWLYPTFSHQQNDGIQEEARPLLQQVEVNRPPAGIVRLQLWAEVTSIYRIREELPALLLSHLHCWSEETVRQRFNYRTPGLYLLVVRVHRVPKPHEIAETPAYAGCRSWVELEAPLSTEGSTPVLDDESFRIVRKQLDLLLSPTAYA
ncbi:MAG: DUF1802 family protein [Planctomycetes bacterium]|nr:DUF1802 family protein [Planctomycetota bacterium]